MRVTNFEKFQNSNGNGMTNPEIKIKVCIADSVVEFDF